MTNKFKEKQYLAELLNSLYEEIENREKGIKQEYKPVGKSTEQAKDWKTGELLWEDDEQTIPKMKDVWDYVPKDEDDLTEEDKLRIKICQQVKAQLERMI